MALLDSLAFVLAGQLQGRLCLPLLRDDLGVGPEKLGSVARLTDGEHQAPTTTTTSSRAVRAPAAAITGLRRHQRQVRSARLTGRAGDRLAVRKRRRSSASSCAVA